MDSINIVWTTYAQEGLVEGTGERVRAVEGYEGYFITDHGRVLTAFNGGGKHSHINFDNIVEKKQRWGGNPKRMYWTLQLWNNSIRKQFQVHVLVARAFISNPSNLPVVNHLEYPSNHYKDLEWTTQQGNCTHGKNSKEHLIQFPNGEIKQIRNLNAFIMEYVRPGISYQKANSYLGHFKKLVKPKNGYKYIGLA